MSNQVRRFPKLPVVSVGLAGLVAALAVASTARAGGVSTVIYNDPTTRVYYPRIMEVRYGGPANGTLLATCEEYKRPMPVHPIFKSTDKGKTWTRIGDVKDTQHEWGMRYQPMLFEVPQAVGRLNKGTILCAGNSIPNDMSKTSIDIYRSDDGGVTWTFMSTVCQGGRASPNSQETPVWEPFLMLDKKGRLVCYESDEREKPDHNQLLCHFISEDGGYTWGPQVDDVALGRLRPGMVVIAALPNGRYIMTYEMVRVPGAPVTYKLSDDGDDWGPATNRGTQIITADDYKPGSTPYCVWAPTGGKNGTIIVSGRVPHDPLGGDFTVNYDCGAGAWYRMRTPIRFENPGSPGYSRSMVVAANGKELYSVACLTNGQRSRLNLTFFRIPLEPAFGWSYELTAACSFKLLTADSQATGVLQATNHEDASQKWALTDAGDGYCRLVASGGQVLEVQGGSTSDGAGVVLDEKADKDNQKWRVRYMGDGFYKLIANHSGKCLRVSGGSKEDGARIQLGPDDGSNGIKWRMDAVDSEDAWAESKWVPNVYP